MPENLSAQTATMPTEAMATATDCEVELNDGLERLNHTSMIVGVCKVHTVKEKCV